MNQYLEIPFRLPGLNEVIEANRRNRHAGAKLKRENEQEIIWCIKSAKLQPVKLPCIVHLTFEESNHRRDVDNVESAKKMVLDALVKAGILQGDSPKWVIGAPSWTRYTDKCRVLVTIIEDEREDWLRERLRRASETVVGLTL